VTCYITYCGKAQIPPEAHFITILKAIFEEDMKIDEIRSLNIKDNLEASKTQKDLEKLRSWIEDRLNKISEKTGADYELPFSLAYEYVDGFKEVFEDFL